MQNHRDYLQKYPLTVMIKKDTVLKTILNQLGQLLGLLYYVLP